MLQPMVLAIAATFCASALVLHFQYKALTALHEQRRVILKQVSQQAATEVARHMRSELNGPVIETINAIDPPKLREPGLDWLAAHFEPALERYPHVERFIVWNASTEAVAPGQVLFYGRDTVSVADTGEPLHGFFADPTLGSAIRALLTQYAPAKKINVVAEKVGPDPGYDVFLRLAFTDSSREECFAVLGYIVRPAMLREPLIARVRREGVDVLLKERGGDTPLELRITDASGAVIHGRRERSADAAGVEFPMLFYPPVPPVGTSQYASSVSPEPWTIEVNARPEESGLGTVLIEFWPTVASVILMLVALGLTLTTHRRASELTRMQADFISYASHQLKTPLSLLSAATETVALERVRTPEKLAQYLGIIRGEVARLSILVQRILEFSRLQQPRRYEFEMVDLSALVRETVEAFEGSLSTRQFTFLVEQGHAMPHVEADPAAIEQVLVNLLDNAVKYSGEVREVTVRVAARPNEAVIEVADRGLGIEHVDLKRIFDKFYRGRHGALNREGFGLGLPIVQELVTAHSGRVEVESEPGNGSTFRVILPVAIGWPNGIPSTS